MKNIIPILLVATVATGWAHQREVSHDEDFVRIKYEFDEPQKQKSEADTTSHFLLLDEFSLCDEFGKPGIPQKTESFTLPPGVKIKDIKVTSRTIDISLKYAAALLPVVESDTLSHYENTITPYSGLWPENAASKLENAIYRDVTFCNILITPIQYDYENQIAVFNKTLTIEIEFENSSDSDFIDGIMHTVTKSEIDDRTSLSLFEDYNVSVAADSESNDGYIYRAPDYLVITPEAFSEAAETFAVWKRRLGYNVTVRAESAENLKNPDYTKSVIYDEYVSRPSLEYVLLLGGGYVITPHIGLFPRSGKTYYTDHYFSCMDGENDLVSDLCIGRLPAKNLTEALIMVNKTIEYEKNPPLDSDIYFNKGLNVAVFDFSTKVAGMEDRRFVLTSEDIRNYLLSKNWDVTRLYKKNDLFIKGTPTLWSNIYYYDNAYLPNDLMSPDFSWAARSVDVKNEIEIGKAYMLYRGHGEIKYLSTIGVTAGEISAYHNRGKYPIFFSITCNSGTFYSTEYSEKSVSVADAFLSNPNGGGAGMIAANQVSLSGPNDVFVTAMFDAIYPNPGLTPYVKGYIQFSPDTTRIPIRKLGKIFQFGMSRMFKSKGVSESSAIYSTSRYNREVFHILADPTIPFYAEQPKSKNPAIMCIGSEKKLVDSRDLVLVDKDSEDVYIYTGTNSKYIEGFDDKYKLSLVGEGYVPLLDFDIQYLYTGLSGKISNISKEADGYTVSYDSNSDNVTITVYNIYGDVVFQQKGVNGTAKLSGADGFNIVVMCENGVAVDSKTVK